MQVRLLLLLHNFPVWTHQDRKVVYFSDNQVKGLGTTREDRKQGAKSYMTAHPQIILPKLSGLLASYI